ncbi:MAG: nickel-responsive transcriptional regulator NikR [Pseudomonadota bacterium]
MERITISLDEPLARAFDDLIRKRGYANRSEAMRDLLRNALESDRLARDEAPHCVAALSYVYDHHERQLSDRLTEMQHHAHDLVVSAMHVHLDHDHCLETLILRGDTATTRAFADHLAAERGVRHAQINLIPVDVDSAGPHTHSKPKT